MKKYLILFLLASILSAKEVYKQIRIYYQNQDQLFQLLQLGIDIDHSHGEKNEWIEFAIAEACPRCSDPSCGEAPGVSIKVTTGI